MATGHWHKKFGEDRRRSFCVTQAKRQSYIQTHKQTNKQTNKQRSTHTCRLLITILCTPRGGQVTICFLSNSSISSYWHHVQNSSTFPAFLDYGQLLVLDESLSVQLVSSWYQWISTVCIVLSENKCDTIRYVSVYDLLSSPNSGFNRARQ